MNTQSKKGIIYGNTRAHAVMFIILTLTVKVTRKMSAVACASFCLVHMFICCTYVQETIEKRTVLVHKMQNIDYKYNHIVHCTLKFPLLFRFGGLTIDGVGR